MRPLVFHLADKSMKSGLRAFFRRPDWAETFGCAPIEIDPESDFDFYQIGGRTDGSLWRNAHEHLATHLHSHEYAVIILDEDFDPYPGATQIAADISQNMMDAGWDPNRFAVIVIEPMLEAWLWAPTDTVAQAFGFKTFQEMQTPLINAGYWTPNEPKPIKVHQKDARDCAGKHGKIKVGSAVFRKVFAQIDRSALDACQEPSFQRMRAQLQSWFPQTGGAA
jgi:hypothetical protein